MGKEKNHTKVYRTKCANFGLVEHHLVLKNEKQEAGEIKKKNVKNISVYKDLITFN